jgi:transposase
LITDGEGQPLGIELTSAKGDERKQVENLINNVEFLLPEDKIIFLEADKGYDSKNLRIQLLLKEIYPLIPYRGNRSRIASWVKRVRWKVERAISWIKRGYRRVATRWERLLDSYKGIVTLSLCYFWIKKIVG